MPSFSTDQYSLAITYYELKTGKLPYEDDSLAAILDAKREASWISPICPMPNRPC